MNNDAKLLNKMVLFNAFSFQRFKLWVEILKEDLGLDPQSEDSKTQEAIEILSELTMKEPQEIDFSDALNRLKEIQRSIKHVTANSKR